MKVVKERPQDEVEELIKKLENVRNFVFYCPDDRVTIEKTIQVFKTLEERPQGEWIIIDDTEQFIAKCSVCGRIEDSRMVKDYSFCHCGADMRGSVDER